MTIQANSVTVPGTYTLLVNAQGGNLNVRIPISVKITAAPAFTLTSSMAVATLRQGSSVAMSLTTSLPTSGFAAAVAFSAGGLPTGVTATFAPASISAPGIGTSVITLAAAPTATSGIFTVTLTATSGVILRTVNLKLTVTPPSTFTLAASLPTYNIIVGGTLSETITVTGLYGYTSNVQLSSAATPAALTISLLNTTVSSNHGTTTLTIQAPPSTTVGSYAVTVTGTDSVAAIAQSTTINILVGSVTATLSAPSISLPIRGSATGVITVTSQSFGGAINISLGTLPLGVTYTLSSNSLLTSGTSTLTLSAASTTLPGIYTVNVRTTAGGIMTTIPLTLVIS